MNACLHFSVYKLRLASISTAMYSLTLTIKSMRSLKPIQPQPRFYLQLKTIHYYISQPIIISQEFTPINIEQYFYLFEEQSQFQLFLLLDHSQPTKKVLGRVMLDAKQWPIDQQKTRIVAMSQSISIEVVIKNSFVTNLALEAKMSESSEIDLIQQRQKQTQLFALNAYLREKNERIKEQLEAERARKQQILNKMLKRQKQIQTNVKQQENAKQQMIKSLRIAQGQLQTVNIQMSSILNLINDHGNIDICNIVLQSLARKQSTPQ